jgi:uncharacterized protein involved in response to NO
MSAASHGLARIPWLSYGFRPFFLGGAIWSACAMPLWIGLVTGRLSFATSYGTVGWHAHEFLFGYVGAIIAGFLLTAIPSWTGRLPVHGGPLLTLFLLWAAGRITMLLVDRIGVVPAAVIDSLFLTAFAAVVLREIIAGRDRRNLKIALLVALFALINVSFHIEVFVSGATGHAMRAAIAIVVVLISLVGGRITPSFTRNWLAKRGSQRLPRPFGRYDMIALAGGVVAALLWIAVPEATATAWAMIVAGALHVVRLSRWAGIRTWPEPLVLILHVGYVFVPLGFLMIGVSVLDPLLVPESGAIHAWTTGAMGVMTLAVMTRASLGHSGRALTASAATQAIYAAIVIAALARMAAPVLGNWSMVLLDVAALAWTIAFAGFAVIYGPLLIKPKFVSPAGVEPAGNRDRHQ